MSNPNLNRSDLTPASDEEIIIDQEIRHPDGAMHRHRETLRQNDPALEQRLERERLETNRQLKIRDNDNAARGLLMGVIITSILGLGILTWFFFTNRQETETTPVVVPVQPKPSPSSSPPDINITVPIPSNATESGTETDPTQPTTIQTQPAPVQPQPSSSSRPSEVTAPAANPETVDSVPTNSSSSSEPVPSTSAEPSFETKP
ncbi:MAG: hypothetical protein HC851_12070 [Acaryochloris sp. RU_4_1]|nr:hypothetical protein [Acaryochloris sp. RU_4_1]NJR54971.1 hypothetical protein [Acaryochloris sp. CRU_2_0]